jgi:hypothetical protein
VQGDGDQRLQVYLRVLVAPEPRGSAGECATETAQAVGQPPEGCFQPSRVPLHHRPVADEADQRLERRERGAGRQLVERGALS